MLHKPLNPCPAALAPEPKEGACLVLVLVGANPDPLQSKKFPPNERTFGMLLKSLIQVRGLVTSKQMRAEDSWDPLVGVLGLAAFN